MWNVEDHSGQDLGQRRIPELLRTALPMPGSRGPDTGSPAPE